MVQNSKEAIVTAISSLASSLGDKRLAAPAAKLATAAVAHRRVMTSAITPLNYWSIIIIKRYYNLQDNQPIKRITADAIRLTLFAVFCGYSPSSEFSSSKFIMYSFYSPNGSPPWQTWFIFFAFCTLTNTFVMMEGEVVLWDGEGPGVTRSYLSFFLQQFGCKPFLTFKYLSVRSEKL